MNRVRRVRLVAGALTFGALASCGLTSCAPPSTDITIAAAASLADVLPELISEFETEHPGVTVRTSIAGSATLLAQLADGAPFDVFLAADEATMQEAIDAELVVDAPTAIASNVVMIATEPDNPRAISTLGDLANPDLRVVLCDQQVPCGAAAAQLIDDAGVQITPASETTSVTDALASVVNGDADAALVYRTSVLAAGAQVTGIAIPGADAAATQVTGAVTAETGSSDAAAFLQFLADDEAQTVLAEAGFGAP